jgi:GNAT superfamily N-acetyltransferase
MIRSMTLPPRYSIRLAKSFEAALLLQVMLEAWAGTVAKNSTAFSETEEGIAHQLARGGAAIVFEGDLAVGAGRFYPVPGPPGDPCEWVEIKRVGLLKGRRKLGLAAPLVAMLEGEARARGYAGAQIGVRHDQPRLVAFWASLGYEVADDVELHTVNPLTPQPVTMRKRFPL